MFKGLFGRGDNVLAPPKPPAHMGIPKAKKAKKAGSFRHGQEDDAEDDDDDEEEEEDDDG
jgi:hypothetical protein